MPFDRVTFPTFSIDMPLFWSVNVRVSLSWWMMISGPGPVQVPSFHQSDVLNAAFC